MTRDSSRSMPSWVAWGLSALTVIGLLMLFLRSGDEAGSGAVSDLPDEVLVAAGDFFAGCRDSADAECLASEKPGKRLSLADFSIDRTEVTVAAYRACVEAGACREPGVDEACNWGLPDREQHPVNCVDWSQAAAYCAWRGVRLPTEWEWEKAARGPQGDKHPWGNAPADCSRAVIDEGSGNACGHGDTTFEVGSKPAGASPYGAVDMIGNVWEWTSTSPERSASRVVRGGAYYVEPKHARASLGVPFKPDGHAPFVGFRCAR